LINEITNDETVKLTGLRISAFSKSHAASDPVSYTAENGRKVSVITDLGYGCENVIGNISDSDILFLESNHDLNMLENGPYPLFLKNWIKSNNGHLSNLQSDLLVLEHAPSRMKHLVLSHLSETNNRPQLALKSMAGLVKERSDLKPKISLSLRNPTELFSI
jgi:phosphoribosyl 1,2-cyclic phosphodiesterase